MYVSPTPKFWLEIHTCGPVFEGGKLPQSYHSQRSITLIHHL